MKTENIFLKIWRIIYPALLYFVISLVISIAAIILLSVKMMSTMGTEAFGLNLVENPDFLMNEIAQYSILITVISAMVILPVLYIFYKGDKRKAGDFQIENKPSPSVYLLVVGAAVFFCIGANNLIEITNLIEFFPGYLEVSEALYGGSFIIEILGIGIIIPIVEELIFRGLIHKRMRNYMKPSYAVVLSSLLFGIYHMNVVQGVYAFILGLAMAYVYEKYQSMAAPILFHMSANLLSVIAQETGVLDWIYGGKVIMLATTLIALVLGGVFLLLINQKVKAEIRHQEIIE